MMLAQPEPFKLARCERQAVLAAFGFAPHQIVLLLEQGVTVEHLRGMLQLRQCEGAPVAVLADIAARIDRIEEFEKLTLDSLTT
jgi:hypothetical protein